MTQETGILAYGAYIPRVRLQRKAIAAANGWFAPGLKSQKGERAIANWDEDAITMGVEAARDCLTGADRGTLDAIVLASTTHPYDDRQNAGVAAGALGLRSSIRSQDAAGSLRAGTSALVAALAAPGGAGSTLVVAADHRQAKAASSQEMAYGDGAAALLVGRGKPIARLLGTHTETVDFVHQFRMHDRAHDYSWEERWVREEGYLKIVPAAVRGVLKSANVDAASITHFCMPCTLPKLGAAVAKKLGIAETAVRDNLAAVCGDTGAAHALVMLTQALQEAKPGDRILVASFGEGCDALLFEVTPAIAALTPRKGVNGALARRREDSNYMRYLAFNGLIDLERGMRAEVDKGTPLTVAYRNRAMITSLVGGKCRKCGTVQYPRGRYCAESTCNALDSQDDHSFAESKARVLSYTADLLTYCPDPPAYYGMIQFDEGGRLLADFSDLDSIEVGTPMRMVFRVKDVDATRGFVRYFWKAVPADV